MFKLKEKHRTQEWAFAFSISNTEDERSGKCMLHVAAFSYSLWFIVPQIFKPKSKWVDLSKDKWAKTKGYMNHIPREYGFFVDKEALHIRYGIQPGHWSSRDKENSDHSKCYFIPWNATRRVQYDFLNLDGTLFASAKDKPNGAINFDSIEKCRETVPKIKFRFNDYDGEEITVTCHREIMRWEYGTGFFKWVKYFRKPIIKDRLDMVFDKETGYEKGSWKGGTMGVATDILPNESILEAFTRYGTSEDYFKGHGNKNRGFTNIRDFAKG